MNGSYGIKLDIERGGLSDKPEGLPWYLAGEEHAGPQLWLHTQAIEQKQFSHHQRLLFNALQYSNRQIAAFDWGWGRQVSTQLLPYRDGVESLVISAGEALVAAIGKNKVKAKPLTKRASFRLRRGSRKLDRFLYGEAKRIDFWEKHKQGYEDAYWGEVGAIFWDYIKGEGVHCERVFPDELIIDNDQCHAEHEPFEVIRRRAVHVESIIERWGLDTETADKLRLEAKTGTGPGWVSERSPGPGWIVVVEGHRLPCGKTPGCHTVGTHTITLVNEVWNEDWLPYTFYHYVKPTSGFYNRSGVEMAWPYQRRLDKINGVIEDAQDLMARPRLWLPFGSKIDVKEITNRVGKMINSAVEPKPLVWPAAPPELYNERERVKASCFESFGLTQMTAQGKLPAGARLDSSEAMREYNAIQDDRLVDSAQRYERFQQQGYDMMIRLSERAHSQGESLKTTWVAGKRVEEINWADVDFSKDRYSISIEPASVVNESSAARMDDAAKLVQSGIITPEEYLSLKQTPDSERLISLKVAAHEDLEKTVEMLEDGKYRPPSPLQDLVNGIPMMHYHLLMLTTEYDDVDQSIQDAFMLWIMQAKWIIETGTQKSDAMAPTPADMMLPPEAGGPMPPQGAMPAGPVDPMAMGMMPQPGGIAAPTIPSLTPSAGNLQ